MSKVDDELTRRLRRAERPVDGDNLFDGLERRRSHRERVRRVQAGMLAFAVLAATAGGFAALRQAFGESGRDLGESPVLAENGEIVFSAKRTDGYAHLYAMQPDGSERRQITDFGTNDTDPTVSPDGRTIAFVHQLEDVDPALATIPIKGGNVTWLSDPGIGVEDPAWSPDGSTIAFVGTAEHTQRIMALDVASGDVSLIVGDREEEEFANPAWSPDGEWLVFSARASGTSDPWELWTMTPDGTQRRQVGWASPERNAAAWSPDGTRIAVLLVHGDRGEPDEVWTTTPDPESEGLVTGGPPVALLSRSVGTSLQPNITWSPDGSTLLVSDGQWIYRVEPVPRGDPQENLTRLGQGSSPAWQPLPAGSEPSPRVSPEPSISPRPGPDRDELGFGFGVCEVSQVRAQFDGVDATDTAFVATEREGSACPSVQSASAHVGIDLDEDGLVDATYGPIACEVYHCRAFAGPDLDDTGTHELLVIESSGSVVGLGLYALGDAASDGRDVVRIMVGDSDLPAAGFVSGEPARLFIGGDEGWSYRLRCEDHGVDRFLYASSAFRKVDGGGPVAIRETTLAYTGMRLIVFDAADREVPASDDPLGPQPSDLCGVPLPAV